MSGKRRGRGRGRDRGRFGCAGWSHVLQPVNDTNHTQLTTRLGLSSSASPSPSLSLVLLLLLHVAAAAADVVAGNFAAAN